MRMGIICSVIDYKAPDSDCIRFVSWKGFIEALGATPPEPSSVKSGHSDGGGESEIWSGGRAGETLREAVGRSVRSLGELLVS